MTTDKSRRKVAATFGRDLRAFRENRHLSQQELADRLGVTQGFIGQLERGESQPSLLFLTALRSIFHVVLERGELVEVTYSPGDEPTPVLGRRRGGLMAWQAALRPALAGSPLEGAIGDLTLDPGEASDKAWAELDRERKQEVLDVLRRMASVAVVIDKTLPKPIAEAMHETLAKKVREYLADAF